MSCLPATPARIPIDFRHQVHCIRLDQDGNHCAKEVRLEAREIADTQITALLQQNSFDPEVLRIYLKPVVPLLLCDVCSSRHGLIPHILRWWIKTKDGLCSPPTTSPVP